VQEIYNLTIRGVAAGTAGTANWLTNGVVSQTFLLLTHALSASGTFLLYASIAAAGTLWSVIFLPETKGLSLAEIQALFKRRAVKGNGCERSPAAISESAALVRELADEQQHVNGDIAEQ
jgi:hypothetical protein